MGCSRVAIVAATLLVAALRVQAASGVQGEPDLTLPVDVQGSALQFGATKLAESSTSAAKSGSESGVAADAAEPKRYALLLAGVSVLVFIARRRRLG